MPFFTILILSIYRMNSKKSYEKMKNYFFTAPFIRSFNKEFKLYYEDKGILKQIIMSVPLVLYLIGIVNFKENIKLMLLSILFVMILEVINNNKFIFYDAFLELLKTINKNIILQNKFKFKRLYENIIDDGRFNELFEEFQKISNK